MDFFGSDLVLVSEFPASGGKFASDLVLVSGFFRLRRKFRLGPSQHDMKSSQSENCKLVPGRALGRALGRVGHPWDDIPKAGTTHSKAKITKLVPGRSSQPVLG